MTRPILICVPGLWTDDGLFAPQAAALADVVDLRVADVSQDDSLVDMAQRLLASVEGPFALAGLSMGGYVAQEVMRQAPHRVTRLALLDTNARADRPEQSVNRQTAVDRVLHGQADAVFDEMIAMLVHEDRLDDASLIDAVRVMSRRVGSGAFARQQKAIMNRPDGREDLPAISVPTLCLCGQQDALTPPRVMQEMVDLLPHGTLTVVDDCGHLSTLERPDTVSDHMRAWILR